MTKGLVVILSGVSSIGKGKIQQALLQDPQLNLMDIVSLTTRPKKDEEVDGRDYYFVSHKDFAAAARNHQLLEYTEFNGYYYGTPAAHAEFLLSMGKNVLISVEAQGVGQIRIKHPDNKAFFLIPVKMEELEKQIRDRYPESDAGLRINKAHTELELAEIFGTSIPFQDQEEAFQQIRAELTQILSQRRPQETGLNEN